MDCFTQVNKNMSTISKAMCNYIKMIECREKLELRYLERNRFLRVLYIYGSSVVTCLMLVQLYRWIDTPVTTLAGDVGLVILIWLSFIFMFAGSSICSRRLVWLIIICIIKVSKRAIPSNTKSI